MSELSTLTPAEQDAQVAFEEYTGAVRLEVHLEGQLTAVRCARAESWDRFSRLYAALDAPTPPDLMHERDQLACEGSLLAVAIAGFVGLVLPADPRPLVIAGLVLPLGAWLFSFAHRLGRHARRRF